MLFIFLFHFFCLPLLLLTAFSPLLLLTALSLLRYANDFEKRTFRLQRVQRDAGDLARDDSEFPSCRNVQRRTRRRRVLKTENVGRTRKCVLYDADIVQNLHDDLSRIGGVVLPQDRCRNRIIACRFNRKCRCRERRRRDERVRDDDIVRNRIEIRVIARNSDRTAQFRAKTTRLRR